MKVEFPTPLTPGTLLKRYKRFLADVELESGEVVVAHCVNTGRMTGCSEPGSRVWLEPALPGSKRKLQWTWVITDRLDGVRVGVHTGYPNRLVAGALAEGFIEELAGYPEVRREVMMVKGTRADVHLSGHLEHPPAWVEVKNVTLVEEGVARFPDAPSERGRKHLIELRKRVKAGERAAMVYVLQRDDARSVEPADDVDPDYGKVMRQAARAGVELYAVRVSGSPEALEVVERLPVNLPRRRRTPKA